MSYIEINEPLNTKYPTWIIAFCPDTDSFFATNERHFFWESEEEFESEDVAIYYFEHQIQHFIDVEDRIISQMWFGKTIDKVFLENTERWYTA